MAATLVQFISPHTGKRRRAPYSRDVCDFCRDSKKRCQPLQSAVPSSAALSSFPQQPQQQTSTTCVACHRANIPCKRSRKQSRKASHSNDDSSDALSVPQSAIDRRLPPPPLPPPAAAAAAASAAPPLPAPASHPPRLRLQPHPGLRVSRFGADSAWLAPLPSVAAGDGWGEWPTSGGRQGSSFVTVRLVRDMPQYFTSFFRLVNDGLYPYLDERQWMADYGHIVVDRILSPDQHWALAFHAVMAIGARIHGDLSYAQHCTAVAMTAARSLSASVQSQPPSRLALTFRALLALTYYCACTHEDDEAEADSAAGGGGGGDSSSSSSGSSGSSVDDLLSSAQLLLSVREVAERVPLDVTRLANSVPQFGDAFSLSPLPACSVVEQLHYQRHTFRDDRKHYARLQRKIAMQDGQRLHDEERQQEEDEDEEAKGEDEGDAGAESIEGLEMGSVAMGSDASEYDVLQALHRLNAALAGDTFMRSRRPVDWSIYRALTVLLLAERSSVVQDLQRVIVFGRRAQCYLLLGQLPKAVQAARQTVRHVAMYDGPLSRYPPYTVLLIRALVILRALDTASDAALLIESGLIVLQKLAALWPALQRHLTYWMTGDTVTYPPLPPPQLRTVSNFSPSSPPWSPPLLLPSTSDLSALPDIAHLVSASDAAATASTTSASATATATDWFGGAALDWATPDPTD